MQSLQDVGQIREVKTFEPYSIVLRIENESVEAYIRSQTKYKFNRWDGVKEFWAKINKFVKS